MTTTNLLIISTAIILLVDPTAGIITLLLGYILSHLYKDPFGTPEETDPPGENPIDNLFEEALEKEKPMEPEGTPSLVIFHSDEHQWQIPPEVKERIEGNSKFSKIYVSGKLAGFAYRAEEAPRVLDIIWSLGGHRWVQVSDEWGSDVPFELLRYNHPQDLDQWFRRRGIFF